MPVRQCERARTHLYTPWVSSDIYTVALLPKLRYEKPITVFSILINKIQSYFITADCTRYEGIRGKGVTDPTIRQFLASAALPPKKALLTPTE